MNFFIEQIALCPTDPIAARSLLREMGAVAWVEDTVQATGSVYNIPGSNEAALAFNYDLAPDEGLELEILHYRRGINWMLSTERVNSVSHLGMHCSAAQLDLWIQFFTSRNIRIAQAVVTDSHSNPAIAGLRRYQYVVFNTRPILGVDLKFIVRLNQDGSPYNEGHPL